MKRSTERLIQILASVNGTAIDNDGGSPGQFIADACHEAAERLRELHLVEQKHLALDKKPKSTTHILAGQMDLNERKDLPDKNCFTLHDGSCVGTNCMHDPQ